MLAILVSPTNPKVVAVVGIVLGSILLTRYFLNCCNCGSDYIT